ncbi:hypothetical protein [Flavobacterium sp.]|uniref:hypothetical protein n=1 Tax=Flavobacterium sp. TaxID=239 RepID=UPI0031DFD005
MSQPFSNKTIHLLKKYTLTALLLFTATYLEMYWAMRSFSEKISSGCLDCSFSSDVNFISIFTTVFLIIVLLILSLIKNVYWKNSLQLLFLIAVWFFWNYVIFVDRESSWSTYTFSEEIQYTISYSVLPILVLSAVTAFSLHTIHKNISKPL